MPALKRVMMRVELPGALKRSYPRINAGASTQRLRSRVFLQPEKQIPFGNDRKKSKGRNRFPAKVLLCLDGILLCLLSFHPQLYLRIVQ